METIEKVEITVTTETKDGETETYEYTAEHASILSYLKHAPNPAEVLVLDYARLGQYYLHRKTDDEEEEEYKERMLKKLGLKK